MGIGAKRREPCYSESYRRCRVLLAVSCTCRLYPWPAASLRSVTTFFGCIFLRDMLFDSLPSLPHYVVRAVCRRKFFGEESPLGVFFSVSGMETLFLVLLLRQSCRSRSLPKCEDWIVAVGMLFPPSPVLSSSTHLSSCVLVWCLSIEKNGTFRI